MKHIVPGVAICVAVLFVGAVRAEEFPPANKNGSSERIAFISPDNSAPYPFSKAVKVGSTLYLSGEIGTIGTTGKLVSGGIQAQTRQTLVNIQTTLEANGYRMGDVVKCTAFLADMAEWPAFNEVYKSLFSKPYPARSALGANGLALGARVEMECIAAR